MKKKFYPNDFGERLKALILSQHPSIRSFCFAKGFDTVSVYTWIKGRQPTRESVYRLCIALDISPAKLTWGKDLGARFVKGAGV